MTVAVPMFVQPVIGFRVWRLGADGLLLPRAVSALERLAAEPWRPGRNDARCMYLGRSRALHRSPRADCDCGLYAYHEVARMARAARAEDCIGGAVAAWGDLEVHRTGFRAQHAQVIALALPDEAKLVASAQLAAARYGVALVPCDELHGRAAAAGAPLPESARPARRRLWTSARRESSDADAPARSEGGRAVA